MEKRKNISFAFNLFLTYLFFSPISLMFGIKELVGFSIGFACAEIVWLMLNEDVKKIKSGNTKFMVFGAIKRYIVFSIVLLIAFSSLSVEGFFSTFLGIEMLTLTLFTSSGLFKEI